MYLSDVFFPQLRTLNYWSPVTTFCGLHASALLFLPIHYYALAQAQVLTQDFYLALSWSNPFCIHRNGELFITPKYTATRPLGSLHHRICFVFMETFIAI